MIQVNYDKRQYEANLLEEKISGYITYIWNYFYDCRHDKDANRSEVVGVYNLIRLKYEDKEKAGKLISTLEEMHDYAAINAKDHNAIEKMKEYEDILFGETRMLSKYIRFRIALY